jgi:hypothetical protein
LHDDFPVRVPAEDALAPVELSLPSTGFPGLVHQTAGRVCVA